MPPRRRADLIVAFPNHGQRQTDFDTPIAESVLSRAWPMSSDSYPAVDREIDRILNCTLERLVEKELLKRIMRFGLDFEANGVLLGQIVAYLMGVAAAPFGVTPVNQVQTLIRSSDVDGGTFRVSIDGVLYTTNLAWNISAVDLKTAIELLAALGSGNTTTAYDAGTRKWTITMIGAHAHTELPVFTVDGALLTVSASPGGSVAAAELTAAVPPQRNQIQTLVLDTPTAGTFRIGIQIGQYIKYSSRLPFDVSAAAMKAAIENLTAIGRSNTTVARVDSGGGGSVHTYTITHVNNLASAEMPVYSVDAAALTKTTAAFTETKTGVQLEHDITEITGFQPPAFGIAVGYKTSNRLPRKYNSVVVNTLHLTGAHSQPRVTAHLDVVGSADVQDVSGAYVLPGCQVFRPIRFKDCILIIDGVNYSDQLTNGNPLMDFDLTQSNGIITDDDAYPGIDEDVHRLERANIRSLIINAGILGEKGDDIYQLAEENGEVAVSFQVGRSNDAIIYVIDKASVSLRNPETVFDGTAKRTKVQITLEPEEDNGGATWYAVHARINESATLLTAA